MAILVLVSVFVRQCVLTIDVRVAVPAGTTRVTTELAGSVVTSEVDAPTEVAHVHRAAYEDLLVVRWDGDKGAGEYEAEVYIDEGHFGSVDLRIGRGGSVTERSFLWRNLLLEAFR